jgi:hypothetical protein
MFVDYARAFAARYGPHGSFWRERPGLPSMPVDAMEIWNEENLNVFWKPAPNAPAYLRLYEAARAAIHMQSRNVEVMVGGLADPAADFISQLYTSGRGRAGLFDAVAIHPYDSSVQAVLDDVTRARAVLDGHGDVDVPLDVTEVGWPTRGPELSHALPVLTDAQRAFDLSQLTSTLARADCGVERILPHTWVTLERNPGNVNDWFGLVHPNGALSASAQAYSSTIEGFEQQPQAVATDPACARPLSIRAASVSTRRSRHASKRSRIPRTYTGCVAASIASRGVPVDGAAVRFTFTADPGRPASTVPSITMLTDASGRAVGCFKSTGATRGLVQLAGSRADFVAQTQSGTTINLRLR